MIDQKKFSVSWIINKKIAICFIALSASDLHTKNKAIPINMYSVVHTGANIQLGGLNQGLLATAYQPFTASVVKKPEIAPTKSGISMEINSFIKYQQ
jgi:hypothetical protein